MTAPAGALQDNEQASFTVTTDEPDDDNPTVVLLRVQRTFELGDIAIGDNLQPPDGLFNVEITAGQLGVSFVVESQPDVGANAAEALDITIESASAPAFTIGTGTASVTFNDVIPTQFYVDAANGDEGFNGTTGAFPFQTKDAGVDAISAAAGFGQVNVESGTYTSSSIVTLLETTLVGNPIAAERGAGVVWNVPGVNMWDFSALVGFTLNLNSTFGVSVGSPGVTVVANTITNSSPTGRGITVDTSLPDPTEIVGNYVYGAFAGIDVIGPDVTDAGVRVQDNVFSGNNIGANIQTGGVDFGGGPAGSSGGNYFVCNTGAALFIDHNGSFGYFQNNFWDDTADLGPPPPATMVGGGVDIARADSAGYTVTAASIAGACDP